MLLLLFLLILLCLVSLSVFFILFQSTGMSLLDQIKLAVKILETGSYSNELSWSRFDSFLFFILIILAQFIVR
uniref:Uncharacterized protein n=1 Tax=Rhizophora mucronata TaxID=61149 RepID=A0A2P2IYG7_RHIMU